MRRTSAITILTIAVPVLIGAAEPVIGFATSQGRLEIDRASADGNATLLNGASLRSLESPVRIRLSNGRSATLGPSSEARIFTDRLLLSKGEALLTTADYRAEALGFSASLYATGAQAGIHLRGPTVEVAALNGPVKVMGAQGIVLARINPGETLSFEPASPATLGTSTMTGPLRQDGPRFLLKDETTNLDVELRGADLNRYAGKRVRVTGRVQPSVDRQSQVILVSRVAQQSGGNRPDTPQQSGGNRPDTEPLPKKEGMSNGAKIAIVAAVAGGAAGGIIAATGKSGASASR